MWLRNRFGMPTTALKMRATIPLDRWASVVLLAALGLGGCASATDLRSIEVGLPASQVTSDVSTRSNSSPAPAVLEDRSLAAAPVEGGTEVVASEPTTPKTAAGEEPSTPPAPAPPAEAAPSEEPLDPFAKEDDAAGSTVEEYDPWESYNGVVFEFNRKVDRYVLKPVAKAYNFVLPDVVQRGVSNFFQNVRFVPRMLNNLLQGKLKGAGIEGGRFLINSTLGVGGFMDPARHWLKWETPPEDFGQTLGVYGVKPGPYLMIPLLPPFTVRDVTGFLVDIVLDPINYFVFPSIELDGAPSLIEHKNRGTTTIAQFGSRVYEIVNDRSLNLETYQGVEEATLDLYVAVRNAYLQKRAKAIKE
jgi:phospholipid-binding lipoprotein MlaA